MTAGINIKGAKSLTPWRKRKLPTDIQPISFTVAEIRKLFMGFGIMGVVGMFWGVVGYDIANLASLKKEEMAKISCVKGKTWEETAVDMGFSYRHTLQIHEAALTEFEKFYKSA